MRLMNRDTVKSIFLGLPAESIYFTVEGIPFMLQKRYSVYEDAWDYSLYQKDDMNTYQLIKEFKQAKYLFELFLDENVEDEGIYLYMKIEDLV